MIPKRQRFRPIALLCALSAALVLYAGCFSSVTGDEDVSGTVAAGGNAPDDPKNEASPVARVVAASELESLTAADLSKEEFGDTYTIQLDGEWTADTLRTFGKKLQEITGKNITLDMAQVTGITIIRDGTFEECTSLVAVEIPANVTYIGNYVFDGCTSLAAVKIPAGVTDIGQGTFVDCESLAVVEIPAGVTAIGEWAFRNCTSLAAVTIPANVTYIWHQAFKNCTSLASITFTGTVAQWNNIIKKDAWHDNVPATKVTCTGGGTIEEVDLD